MGWGDTLQVVASSLIGHDLWRVGKGLPEGLTVLCLCVLGSPLGIFCHWIWDEEIYSKGWDLVGGPALMPQIFPESPRCEDHGQ